MTKSDSVSRLRAALEPFGLVLGVQSAHTGCDADRGTLVRLTIAHSDFGGRLGEPRLRIAFAAFYASCSAEQQRWFDSEFKFEEPNDAGVGRVYIGFANREYDARWDDTLV